MSKISWKVREQESACERQKAEEAEGRKAPVCYFTKLQFGCFSLVASEGAGGGQWH